MARDLVSRNLLIGKSRTQVKDMLGNNNMNEEQNKISYELEEQFGWGIDPVAIEQLDIISNQEDKVEKAEITLRKVG